ncbi:GtrA family protein [Terricaulis silvestris]|uniref:GtrA family protein n=1 Tax=Terricaulis silvestris TaxID=2686094 RepID=UPI00131ECB57|nr:GtrA family protein [Terricaulis silvestris]
MKLSGEILRFVGVGAFAALVNWVSRIALSVVLPLSAAIIVAYLIGMITAYALSRKYVFQPTERGVGSELTRFALVNVVALVQVWAVTIVMAEYVLPALHVDWRPLEVAHAVGVASPIVTSYLGHRYFSFAQARKSGRG